MIRQRCCPAASALLAWWGLALAANCAVGQSPVLETVFPAGAQVGQSVEVTLSGTQLDSGVTLHCSAPGVRCEPIQTGRFRLIVPADALPGHYDLWAVGDHGVSAPRAFVIGLREEQLERESADDPPAAQQVPLDVVLNGRLDSPGDVDRFQFEAKQGQRVVLECLAERIDSRMRAVLEVFDADGRRLGVNRGYYGIDPLLDFHVPADGAYVVHVRDLTGKGGTEHLYRLDIDTGPRVAFATPAVVQRGQAARIVLHGWNLSQKPVEAAARKEGEVSDFASASELNLDLHSDVLELEQLVVEIPPQQTEATWPWPVRLQPAQAALEGFAYHLPGSHAAIALGVTEVPVVLDRANHGPAAAQELSVPCEVSGQLVAGVEVDFYSLEVRRGEVLYFEVWAQRIGAPADMQLSVLDSAGQRELAQFSDERRGQGPFPTAHLDPAGRWVAPADGRYLLAVRNLIGGLDRDPRRVYRLSVRREEPAFQVVALPRGETPAGLNVPRGGRAALDLVAFRQRGMNQSIRVAAIDVPPGIECPEVWLGPGVDRATMIVSADRADAADLGLLQLRGFAEDAATGVSNSVVVRGGTLVRSGVPTGWGRLTSQLPLATSGEAPLRITANGHEPLDHHLYGTLRVRHSPGGILDVSVRIERADPTHRAPIKLIGVGLPEMISNQVAIVAEHEQQGYLSFYLPPTLPVGRYSLAVQAETTVPGADNKPQTVVVVSNAVNFEVEPAAFRVELEPFAVTRAKRGETIQVGYAARRLHGFIGKMHTELATPGRVTNVEGLRGRGETFVGQTDHGSLQVVVNDDAPLGPQRFLRLFTVGVVEDEPVYFGSCFFPLEIVE